MICNSKHTEDKIHCWYAVVRSNLGGTIGRVFPRTVSNLDIMEKIDNGQVMLSSSICECQGTK